MPDRKSKVQGFTLIELLVTISIIAILSAIALVAYSSIMKQGRDSKRQSDLRSIQSALEQYNSDQGYYPSDIPASGLLTNCTGRVSCTVTKTYMNNIPADSDSSKNYYYALSGTSYELCAALDITPSSPASCGGATACGVACNFKVTPP